MKSASDFLWQLVQTMSGAEKLYFKRNFVVSKSEPVYIKLFNAIVVQKKYDEDAIIKKYTPVITKKNIASLKNYLQQMVGEALIHFDNQHNTSHSIYEQIALIRVYRKKGLLDEANVLWKKAVLKARSSESFALLNLLKTEFEKMILSSSAYTSFDDLNAIFKNNLITYTQYAELITLRDIYTEVLLIKRTVHFDLDETQKIKINQLLNQVNESSTALDKQSFWHRHYYQLNKATLLYLLNDFAASLHLLKACLNDWRKNDHFISTHCEYYIELLYMINYAGVLDNSYNYVIDVFNLPMNDLITENAQRANFESIKYLALNKIYNKTAKYDAVQEKEISPMGTTVKCRFKPHG